MSKSNGWNFWKATGFLIASTVLFAAAPGLCDQTLESVSQTVEGGKGLLFMQSARTYGNSALVIGAKALYERREYPVFWKNSNHTDDTTILSVPVTIGITDNLDITGSFYVFHDARPYKSGLRYGLSDYGFGSSHVAAKLRYPFEMDSPVQLAIKLGVMFDTSKYQIDGLNYRWTRTGTDYDASLLQTFDLNKKFSLLLEEGYTVSGSTLYDDQIVGAIGVQMRPNDRWTFGLEANNRTFNGVSPQSIFQAGMIAKNYENGTVNPAHIGQTKYVKDGKADFMKDYFIIAPSLSYRLNDHFALDLGAAVNVADQKDPKETVQVVVGLSYGTIIPWSADSDGDGVKNRNDKELNTPAGYPVDTYGVSLDTDRDGVPDGRDQEKNTPRGVKVDNRGVGIDTDGDGVLDGLDKEVNTPAGYPVDTYGVSLDTDRDGVPDGMDREKNTPAGYPVDKYGISLDDDHDGVPNGRDKELNTPSGYPVDEFGVALKEKERTLIKEGIIRLNAVYFDTGKSVIKPESYTALDEVVDILKKYPNLKMEIQGHTDNTGNIKKNRVLSKNRAQAVLEYILKRESSISRTNFTVVGYGPDKPVADNATVDGRQANRRVDFVVLNKEVFQKK